MVESNRAECNTKLLHCCQTPSTPGPGRVWSGLVLHWGGMALPAPNTWLEFRLSSVRPGPLHEPQTCLAPNMEFVRQASPEQQSRAGLSWAGHLWTSYSSSTCTEPRARAGHGDSVTLNRVITEQTRTETLHYRTEQNRAELETILKWVGLYSNQLLCTKQGTGKQPRT